MNLVAKEYLVSRHDLGGMLILSEFTGAARELRDALIINPYDVDSIADAIFLAIEMNPKKRRSRMLHLRETVKRQNIYRWAASLIGELCEVRIEGQRSFRPELTPAHRLPGEQAEVAGKQPVYDLADPSAVRPHGHQVGA
jgi:trehalose-6-phosphate synthase